MATAETEFTQAASDATIEKVAAALTANNIEAIVVQDGDEAKRLVLERIPVGAEIHTAKSKTIEDTGLYAELNDSGRYNALRPRYTKMDRKTRGDEIRKLIAAPDWMVGSVQALTDDGTLVVVSYSASQIGPYAAAAGHVLLVVGSQKIVPDLDAALVRIRDVAFPYENAQVQARMGVDTILAKLLVIYAEWQPGRTTVVLVREPVGV